MKDILVSVIRLDNVQRNTYDENDRLTAVEQPDDINCLILQKSVDKNGTVIAQYEYTLGKNGEKTEYAYNSRNEQHLLCIRYQSLSQTLAETDGKGNVKAEYTRTESWQYSQSYNYYYEIWLTGEKGIAAFSTRTLVLSGWARVMVHQQIMALI
ncbi:MAG: hypothetical protein NC300_10145 [Bacteroidales bacterium]|nr:hypothetical protein [Clostridium sp.]MCM1204490.1 hypothetical protein [Bacteroidales bacterium]